MENTCIRILSKEHGEKVIEYYKSLDIYTENIEVIDSGRYLCFLNGALYNFKGKPDRCELIEIPTEEPCDIEIADKSSCIDLVCEIEYSLKYLAEIINTKNNYPNINKLTIKDAQSLLLYTQFIKDILTKINYNGK